MNKLRLLFVGLLVMILIAANTYAAPPVTQVGIPGTLAIEFPPIQYYPINSNITLNFHVYNATGHPLTNLTTSCFFHLYNNVGAHIFEGASPIEFDTLSAYDWRIRLSDKNISRLGEYAYIVQCNNTINGGFVASSFLTVMDQNKYLYGDIGSQNYDIVLIFGLMALAFFLIYFSEKFKIEGESFIKAITALGINLVFKLSAFGVMIYDLLLLRQVIPGSVTSYTNLFDPMLQMLMYGVGVLFFILYFINSVATLAYNFKMNKQYKTQERKYG